MDAFTEAARAEAEALVDDIIRWDDSIATDGPCDGTWDSLAAYLTGRGWARTYLEAQEPTDAEVLAAAHALHEEMGGMPDEFEPMHLEAARAALVAARNARMGH